MCPEDRPDSYMKHFLGPACLLVNPFTACSVSAELPATSLLPSPFPTRKMAASLALSHQLESLSLHLHLRRSSPHFSLRISQPISLAATSSSPTVFLRGAAPASAMLYLLDAIAKLSQEDKKRTQRAVVSHPACDVHLFCRGYCSDYGSVMISKQR